jgi:hypothetical protein
MSILFVTIALVLLSGPMYTQSLFRSAYEWEEKQIRVDNALIRLGQKLRQILLQLEDSKNVLKTHDRVHHTIHLCASTPGPQQIACKTADRLHEVELRSFSESARMNAEIGWHGAWLVANTEILEVSTRGRAQFSGPSSIPIDSRICSVCRLPLYWKVSYSGFKALADPEKQPANRASLKIKDEWDKSGSWNFLLGIE